MAYLNDRSILRSVMRRVRELFENPPHASGFYKPYTVYDEVIVRQFNADNFDPEQHRPCMFLCDTSIRPAKMPLPYLSVELEVENNPVEIGSEKGWKALTHVHVFGRSIAESGDIASAIGNFFGNHVAMYDYRVNTSGSFVNYAMVLEGRHVGKIELPNSRDDLRVEATLDAWYAVMMELQTLS